ncbi:GNAT family N-acetyltransferase [Leifsonia poae]|uniref:GNAT family N-acetyltransferase n=1 Tax=Leifsonia poae TaxID=110933 RepID=UPI001CBD2CA6|nr:GNAT family N-acetyltransferase [Leifsonia poae]
MTLWQARASVEDDWAAYRALRLEMLDDTPMAFLETTGDALRHSEEHWRSRAANRLPGSRLFGAVDRDGRWIGTMGGFRSQRTPDPILVGVYVTPAYRGRANGVADALLALVIDWARTQSDRLLLEVHEHNEPAIRYYRRHGFEPTGVTVPYPLDTSARELEFARPLVL